MWNVFYFQGWTKFYEFSLSDLRAGFEIIDRLFEGRSIANWTVVGNSLHLQKINNWKMWRLLIDEYLLKISHLNSKYESAYLCGTIYGKWTEFIKDFVLAMPLLKVFLH